MKSVAIDSVEPGFRNAWMKTLSIGRSLLVRQLLFMALPVALGIMAYISSLELREIARAVAASEPSLVASNGIEREIAAETLFNHWLEGTVLGCLLILGVSIPVIQRTVARPVQHFAEQMAALANGDTGIEITGIERADEIGAIARSLCVLRDAVRSHDTLLGQLRTAEDQEAQLGRETAVQTQFEAFAAELSATMARLGDMTKRMADVSQRMMAAAHNAMQGSSQAKTASTHAAGDVASVANAAEQLFESIDEISRQVVQSTQVVKQAVSESLETNAGMERLSAAARRVGDVVSLISRIAAQTNLLALNATIEAARAGEAGRGFAVVAQEVKTLATQTAKATQDISGQIADMQAATETSVGAIDTIQHKIGEVEQISAIIAAAVQEQGASTQEIARNVRSAASGTAEMSTYVENVATAVAETSTNLESVVELARELEDLTATVNARVVAFTKTLQAA